MQDNSTSPTPASNHRLPENATLQHVAKLSIIDDKPIMMDYWTSSLEKESLIGVKETQEKLLVKSEDEYTSCLLYTSPSPRDLSTSRMPSSA